MQVFNIQTLWVKFVSCATAVGSGLPVGPEGPMVHIGDPFHPSLFPSLLMKMDPPLLQCTSVQ